MYSNFLLSTGDVPTKQYIQYKNLLIEPNDKKFVLKGGDLDANHLLIKQIVNKKDAKEYILDEVEKWENENVFSATEKVGEDFDLAWTYMRTQQNNNRVKSVAESVMSLNSTNNTAHRFAVPFLCK